MITKLRGRFLLEREIEKYSNIRLQEWLKTEDLRST